MLNELYHDCCEHSVDLDFDVNLSDEIDVLVSEMVQEVWRLQGTDGNVNEAIAKYFSDRMWSGVIKGFGNNLDSVDYDSPDYNMLTSLKKNVWSFSSAKNYQQLRELSDALIGEDGKLRTFEQFKEAAGIINEKFMKTWLRTEYNLAVAGGQMAGKWVDIQRNASTLPLLEFDVVMDGQTTDICVSLNGIIVPITHPMVARFYPPNHFGCRTTVRQLASGKITPDSKMSLPEIPKMFQTNLAQHGLVFPEDHPYFIGLPDNLK